MEHLNGLKLGIAAVVGALTGFWGWFGWLVLGWLACMVLDYLSGTMAAASKGQWASSTAREGIWHKAGMIIVVMVSGAADLLISTVLTNITVIHITYSISVFRDDLPHCAVLVHHHRVRQHCRECSFFGCSSPKLASKSAEGGGECNRECW